MQFQKDGQIHSDTDELRTARLYASSLANWNLAAEVYDRVRHGIIFRAQAYAEKRRSLDDLEGGQSAIGRGDTTKNMTDLTSKSRDKLDNGNDSGPWYEGTHGERIAVRLSSLDTKGAYAIVESVAAPGCATPMHLHRNEAEHFVIIEGTYRIAIGEKIFEASAGASMTLPMGVSHSWRNISSEPGRMVVILTPGGFEQCVQTIRNSSPEMLEEVAARYGWLHHWTACELINQLAVALPRRIRRHLQPFS